jgi:hypothetical protein
MNITLSTTHQRVKDTISASRIVVNRFTLTSDHVEEVIEDLVRFMNYSFETESVFKEV